MSIEGVDLPPALVPGEVDSVVETDGESASATNSDADSETRTSEVRYKLHAVRIHPDGRIEGRMEGATAPIELHIRDLATMRFEAKLPNNRPKRLRAILVTGEHLCLSSLESADGENLRARSPHYGDLEIPLTALAAVVLHAETPLEEVAAKLRQPAGSEPGDLVWLRNQDHVRGTLDRIEPGNLVLEDGQSIPRGSVLAILFDPSLADYSIESKFFAEVRSIDGSVVFARSLHNTNTPRQLEIEFAFGGTATIDADDLVDIRFRNGRFVYLSDLEPSRVQLEPYLDAQPTWHRGRSAVGTPLRLGGRTYDHGLGVPSRSRLEFPLEPDVFERFEAMIGIDELAGLQANAVFRVELDGQVVFDSGPREVTDSPENIHVPLGSARTLALVVDYGARGDVEDLANWVDARLVRRP